MSSGDLLAHVVSRFTPQQWENVATEALAYIVARPGADEAVRRVLAPVGVDLPSGLRWRTQVRSADDTSIPDLVAEDGHGRPVVIVEVKFWAALTANQPSGYLDRQARRFADDPQAARLLAFLVPERRLDLVASEIGRRLGMGERRVSGTPVFGPEERAQVVVLTWADLLTSLEGALRSSKDEAGLQDLGQLRGLCDRADAVAMMPLGAEDLGTDRGRRLFEFCTVLDLVVDRLVADGVLSTRGFRGGGGRGWYGRGASTKSGTSMRLEVNTERWAWEYPTPFWALIWGGDDETLAALHPLMADGTLSQVTAWNDSVYVAVDPPLLCEQPEIVQALANSVRLMCRALPERVTVTPADELNEATDRMNRSENA